MNTWEWEIETNEGDGTDLDPAGNMFLEVTLAPNGELKAEMYGYRLHDEEANMRIDPAQFEAMCRSYIAFVEKAAG